MDTEVRRNDEHSRYELTLDGRLVGVAQFYEVEGAVVIPHTEIDPSLRGRGLGDILVEGTLSDLRSRSERVVPACWFVAQYVADHPEHADLLAEG